MRYQFPSYIKDNYDFLKGLSATKSDKKKNKLLQNAGVEQILGIVEICLNVLRSNFQLTKKQRKKLSKHADFYRALSRSRTEKTARTRIQQGSGIALGAILIPVLGALAEHLITKIVE